MGQFFARIERELTLHVRYLAWLGAKPKPDPRSKRAKDWDRETALTRAEEMKKNGVRNPPMPPVSLPHIIERLVEIGITEAAGMGTGPISWATIGEWSRQVAIVLSPWESRILRKLSLAYVAESHRAESENCPPPWRARVTQKQRDAETAALRMAFG